MMAGRPLTESALARLGPHSCSSSTQDAGATLSLRHMCAFINMLPALPTVCSIFQMPTKQELYRQLFFEIPQSKKEGYRR